MFNVLYSTTRARTSRVRVVVGVDLWSAFIEHVARVCVRLARMRTLSANRFHVFCFSRCTQD